MSRSAIVGLYLALGLVATGVVSAATGVPGSFSLSSSTDCFDERVSVSLRWTGSTEAEWYVLYRDGTAIATRAAAYSFSTPVGDSFVDNTAGSSQTYRYRVLATNSGSSTTWSNEVAVTTGTCVAFGVSLDTDRVTVAPRRTPPTTEATLTATIQGLPAPPQPTSSSLDFDDQTPGEALFEEYQASHGVTFRSTSGRTQDAPIVVGPGLPVGNACSGGTSEASSLQNFLAPHSEHNLNFGGTGFGGFVATFAPPITQPAMTLISVGSSTVTVSYRRVDGTSSTQTVGPNPGPANGACNKDRLSYAGGDALIEAITVQSNAPAPSEDGIGIDSLTFSRPPVGSADPFVFWYVSDPALGEILPLPSNRGRFVVRPDAVPGTYSRAINVVVSLGVGSGVFTTDAADLVIEPGGGGGGEITIGVTPSRVELRKGVDQIFTASVSGVTPTPTISWTSAAGLGGMDPATGSQSTLRVDQNAPVGTYAEGVTASITIEGVTYRDSAEVIVVDAPQQSQVIGDVFAGGDVSGLQIDPSSVVSASGTVSVSGTSNTVSSYSNQTETDTRRLLETLKAEQAVRYSSTAISGTFNLSPRRAGDPTDTRTNAANPEGGVWYIPGDLQIGTTTFTGRGTLIVGGNVTVSGDVSYPAGETDSVAGIIVDGGNLTIDANRTVVGAYYAPGRSDGSGGTITIGGGVRVPRGLFVGRTVSLTGSDIQITYDTGITARPPLGFAQSFLPSLGEVTP